MNMKMFDGIRVVLWDIDGTILNFFEAQKNAIRRLFEEYHLGECDDDMLNDYDSINHKYWQLLECGKLTKPEVLTGRFYEFFQKYNLDTSVVENFNSDYQIRLGDTICFYPGVWELLQKLKSSGIVQIAVTNGTKIAQTKKLSKSGLDQLFDAIFISEDVGYEKPSPLFFHPVYEIAKQLCGEIDLSEMMIIGDSCTSDIQLGNNVGIRTCWFRHPGQKDTTLRVDAEISSFLSEN